LPAAAWTGWTQRKDPRIRFLLAWVIPGWLLFEAAPAKLAHYTLPVHGGILLLGAIGLLADAWDRRWVRVVGLAYFGVGGLILAAVPIALANDVASSATAIAPYYTLIIAMIVATSFVLVLRKSNLAAPNAALAAVVVSLAIKGFFVPSLPELNVSTRVSDALETAGLHPRLSDGQPGPLIGFGYQEPSLIFATRTDSALSSVMAATQAAQVGSGVVVTQDDIATLNQALTAKGLKIAKADMDPIVGTNYSKGDPVTLIIGKVTPLTVTAPVP
jgi:4-amino-4-deoxy-L-arabinose transferase-like glycosyltransferase